jgi:hypothetical protein
MSIKSNFFVFMAEGLDLYYFAGFSEDSFLNGGHLLLES